MNQTVRAALDAALQHLGYRLTRLRPPNRFQAMRETIDLLRQRGFHPSLVIDAGANTGEWTRITREIFPAAAFHLIEPQSGCLPALRLLLDGWPQWQQNHASPAARCSSACISPVALAGPGAAKVLLAGGGAGHSGTGAHVVQSSQESDACWSPATTLDALFPDLHLDQRPLLKLDLEGFELPALAGAQSVLPQTEVVITEAAFFSQNPEIPSLARIIAFFDQRGFCLYDIASLSPRGRDQRARQTDLVFVHHASALLEDRSWA